MTKIGMFDLDYKTRNTCVILPEFLTPEFAKKALAIHRKNKNYLCTHPRRNERFSQVKRYKAIAQGKDYDAERDATLIWLGESK